MKVSTLLLFIATLVITSAAQTQQPKSTKRGLPQGWTSRYISYAGPLTSGRMANPEAVNRGCNILVGRLSLIEPRRSCRRRQRVPRKRRRPARSIGTCH